MIIRYKTTLISEISNEVLNPLNIHTLITVPFAVEERSGTITVVNELAKYDRALYDFEAVASHEKDDVTLVTNVTIHVVDPEDERGILMK